MKIIAEISELNKIIMLRKTEKKPDRKLIEYLKDSH